MKDLTVTDKAYFLMTNSTKRELAEELGISRPTLDTRLSGTSEWKKLEIKWINQLYKNLNNDKGTV